MKQIFTYFKYQYIIPTCVLLLTLCIDAGVTLGKPYRSHYDAVTTQDAPSRDDSPEESDEENVDDVPIEIPEIDLPVLIISAVNPGYKVDDKSDVGELIELRNLSDTPLSLAGFSLRYTNGAGNATALFEFPNGSLMTGEYLLFSYQKSPNAVDADVVYTSSLALSAGPLELIYFDEVVDSVCWNGSASCLKAFKTASPTTIVRDLETGEFIHQVNFSPHFSSGEPRLYLPPKDTTELEDLEEEHEEAADPKPVSLCSGIEFTEILSYYSDMQSEQFIELYNHSGQEINLENCQIRYKNKLYSLSGNISPDEYFAYYPGDKFSLTKNPTTSNKLELLNLANELIDEIDYPKGQKKETSYAKFIDFDNSESWAVTYYPTPGAANIYQEFRTCPTGKIINPETGNCINATSTTAAECPEGKYRNPLTGRCKNIESSTSTLTPCAEGYERNPETNRCRKIKTENTGADYALIPSTNNQGKRTSFVAFGIVIGLVAIGVAYIILQFRHEIARATRKASQRFNHLFKDLLARKIGSHWKKKP